MTRDLNPRARLCTGESFAAKTLAISVNRIRFPIYIHNFELKWAPSLAKICPLPLKAGAEFILEIGPCQSCCPTPNTQIPQCSPFSCSKNL